MWVVDRSMSCGYGGGDESMTVCSGWERDQEVRALVCLCAQCAYWALSDESVGTRQNSLSSLFSSPSSLYLFRITSLLIA